MNQKFGRSRATSKITCGAVAYTAATVLLVAVYAFHVDQSKNVIATARTVIENEAVATVDSETYGELHSIEELAAAFALSPARVFDILKSDFYRDPFYLDYALDTYSAETDPALQDTYRTILLYIDHSLAAQLAARLPVEAEISSATSDLGAVPVPADEAAVEAEDMNFLKTLRFRPNAPDAEVMRSRIIYLANHQNPEVRVLALKRQAEMGRKEDTVPMMEQALADEDANVKLEALYMVESLGEDAENFRATIIDLMEDNQIEVAEQARDVALFHYRMEDAADGS